MSHTPTNPLSPISKLVVAGPASTVMSPIEAESPLTVAVSPEPQNPSLRPRRSSNHSYGSQAGSGAVSVSNTAAQHLISDILSTKDAALKEKAGKATEFFSTYIQTLFNDASNSLYQITDLIHQKLPKIVEEKKSIQKKSAQLGIVNSDLEDAHEALSTLSSITSLSTTQRAAQRAILAATRIKAFKRHS